MDLHYNRDYTHIYYSYQADPYKRVPSNTFYSTDKRCSLISDFVACSGKRKLFLQSRDLNRSDCAGDWSYRTKSVVGSLKLSPTGGYRSVTSRSDSREISKISRIRWELQNEDVLCSLWLITLDRGAVV